MDSAASYTACPEFIASGFSPIAFSRRIILSIHQGDGVRRNRSQELMTPGCRKASRSFLLAPGAGKSEKRCEFCFLLFLALRAWDMDGKLKLSENHRRVVSVLLRGLEQACDEIDASFQESPGTLRQIHEDLSAPQRSALRQMTQRVRGEIRRLASEIELDSSSRSQRRTVLALLSASIVNLEESEPRKLRGYGSMSPEAEARLSAEFQRLLSLLEQMVGLVEQD
jgi:hypothetical protein